MEQLSPRSQARKLLAFVYLTDFETLETRIADVMAEKDEAQAALADVRQRLRDLRDQASELQELLKGLPAIGYLVTDLVNEEWAWAIHRSKKKAEQLCAALLVDPLTPQEK